jgi:hypothetical protein
VSFPAVEVTFSSMGTSSLFSLAYDLSSSTLSLFKCSVNVST